MSLPAYNPFAVASPLVGAIEAGVLANVFITGSFFIQIYIYFTRFPEDKWPFKIVALILMSLQITHFVSECAFLWNRTIIPMGSPMELLALPTSMIAVMVSTNVVALFVQLFFVYRLWKLSRKSWGPTIIGVCLTCVRQVPAYIAVARAYTTPDIMTYWTKIRTIFIIAFISVLVSDVWITFTTAYYLWTNRKSDTLGPTRFVIDTLILWAVETGFCTSFISMLLLVLFLLEKTSYIWISVFIIYGSVYTNALMAALNGRWILQRRSYTDEKKIADVVIDICPGANAVFHSEGV